jgi:hypothetical protein
MKRSSFLFGLLACASVHAGPPNGAWSNFTKAHFRTRDPPPLPDRSMQYIPCRRGFFGCVQPNTDAR